VKERLAGLFRKHQEAEERAEGSKTAEQLMEKLRKLGRTDLRYIKIMSELFVRDLDEPKTRPLRDFFRQISILAYEEEDRQEELFELAQEEMNEALGFGPIVFEYSTPEEGKQ